MNLNISSLVDTHAHLNADVFESDLDTIIQNAKEVGLSQIFDVSVDLKSSKKSLEISKKYEGFVKSFVGVDPEILIPGSEMYTKDEVNDAWMAHKYKILFELITENRELVVGVGETGMDHYWLDKAPPLERGMGGVAVNGETSKLLQERLFKLHLELAQKFNLPLTIHSRGAEEECINAAKSYKVTGIFHSYTGTYDTAIKILDAGFGLGVNGIVTFKSANELRAIYKKILGNVSADWSPEDFYEKGIFFETDAPFLSPEGKRGERNEPGNVKTIFEQFLDLLCSANI